MRLWSFFLPFGTLAQILLTSTTFFPTPFPPCYEFGLVFRFVTLFPNLPRSTFFCSLKGIVLSLIHVFHDCLLILLYCTLSSNSPSRYLCGRLFRTFFADGFYVVCNAHQCFIQSLVTFLMPGPCSQAPHIVFYFPPCLLTSPFFCFFVPYEGTYSLSDAKG